MFDLVTVSQQVGLGLLFYTAVVLLFRAAGKRLAGQTTTFDLIVMISLVVALQQATLKDGFANAIVFVLTVFFAHIGLARLCLVSTRARDLVRGRPCPLVRDGEILHEALRREGLSVGELEAGLRKIGISHVRDVKAAHLEETGQISAIQS